MQPVVFLGGIELDSVIFARPVDWANRDPLPALLARIL